jgi:hypothetical protein
MSRASLCLAMAALVACTVAGDALAHGHGHGHGHHHTYVYDRVFGFLDYRHSVVDRDDRYRSHLDRRREYVFHHMSPQEAFEEWHGGGHGRAHSTKKTVHHGGGPHRHAWGVHSSDHE